MVAARAQSLSSCLLLSPPSLKRLVVFSISALLVYERYSSCLFFSYIDAGNVLSVDDFNMLMQLLRQKLGSVEVLDISDNRLTDAVLPLLTEALSRNQVLQDLSLASNNFTGDGLYQILGRPRASLRALDISYSRLEDSAWRIWNQLSLYNSLARLDVVGIGISESEFSLLVGSLPTSICIINARSTSFLLLPLLRWFCGGQLYCHI